MDKAREKELIALRRFAQTMMRKQAREQFIIDSYKFETLYGINVAYLITKSISEAEAIKDCSTNPIKSNAYIWFGKLHDIQVDILYDAICSYDPTEEQMIAYRNLGETLLIEKRRRENKNY